MPLEKLSPELGKMKISDHPAEGIKFNVLDTSSGCNSLLEVSGVRKQPMKQKFLLRRPRVHCLYGQTRADGLDWVHKNVTIEKDAEESNWVNITGRNKVSGNAYDVKGLLSECESISEVVSIDLKKVKEAYQEKLYQIPKASRSNAYDFTSMISECEKLEKALQYEGAHPPTQNADEVNVDELSCYLENMANIPKKLSAMAEMMYT
ncbi:uncharacterized protein LOC108030255 [Drosophila biarmipes]|uniref:uncharacterized protein LOC108030255 n=1 Tax=Drosophila biarmipes TaxID=125945 RepID=UPI0007E63E1E|nr:uncharacterized protein LOC108030255 [Drosophila biarmipes]